MSPVLTGHSGEWKSHQSGSANKGAFILVDIFFYHFSSDSLHSNRKWAHALLRHCSDPQLTDSDEVLLKAEELVQFIRTLLGVR